MSFMRMESADVGLESTNGSVIDSVSKVVAKIRSLIRQRGEKRERRRQQTQKKQTFKSD